MEVWGDESFSGMELEPPPPPPSEPMQMNSGFA